MLSGELMTAEINRMSPKSEELTWGRNVGEQSCFCCRPLTHTVDFIHDIPAGTVSHQSAALLHFILKIKHTAVFVILFRKPASGTTPVYSFTLVLQLFHTLTNKQQCDSADSEQRQHLAVFHRFDTLKVDSRQFN